MAVLNFLCRAAAVMQKISPSQQNTEKTISPSALLGKMGEDIAEQFLLQKGWRILARNWKSKHLELDIVAEDRDTLVFVEVKTRRAGGMQHPFEALTAVKKSRLLRAAQAWLFSHQAWDRACRFDLICITEQNKCYHTELISHVIELGEQNTRNAVDRGNTTWQPW